MTTSAKYLLMLNWKRKIYFFPNPCGPAAGNSSLIAENTTFPFTQERARLRLWHLLQKHLPDSEVIFVNVLCGNHHCVHTYENSQYSKFSAKPLSFHICPHLQLLRFASVLSWGKHKAHVVWPMMFGPRLASLNPEIRLREKPSTSHRAKDEIHHPSGRIGKTTGNNRLLSESWHKSLMNKLVSSLWGRSEEQMRG